MGFAGGGGPELLSLWPVTSQVTSSPSLTFRVRAALGKCCQTDLEMQGMAEVQGGQGGLAPLHYHTSYRPVFCVSGDLAMAAVGLKHNFKGHVGDGEEI